jgi:hypothetical protein
MPLQRGEQPPAGAAALETANDNVAFTRNSSCGAAAACLPTDPGVTTQTLADPSFAFLVPCDRTTGRGFCCLLVLWMPETLLGQTAKPCEVAQDKAAPYSSLTRARHIRCLSAATGRSTQCQLSIGAG